jgi:hypothetical protein
MITPAKFLSYIFKEQNVLSNHLVGEVLENQAFFLDDIRQDLFSSIHIDTNGYLVPERFADERLCAFLPFVYSGISQLIIKLFHLIVSGHQVCKPWVVPIWHLRSWRMASPPEKHMSCRLSSCSHLSKGPCEGFDPWSYFPPAVPH